MKKVLIFLLSLALAGIFVSCNDGIDSDSEAFRASADGKTYLVIGEASLGRSVLSPKATDEDVKKLTNFTLTGVLGEELDSEAVVFIKPEEAESFDDLSGKQIEIEAGNWTFTLSAELNGVPFSDTKSIEIKAGVVNTLSFDLKADSSYGGGISVTLNFPLDKSINSVVAKLSDPSGTNESVTKTFELADFAEVKDTAGEVKEYSVTYSRNLSEEASRISAGSYYLVFDFMAEGTSVPINSFPYYVRVVSGFTSSAVDSVKLNETYSITYSYFANGKPLEATDSSIGIADSPEGFVFPAKYSRKSDTISLPAMAKTVTEGEAGYVFAGWFEDADLTRPITEIAVGSTGNKNLYGAFINSITVSDSGSEDANVLNGEALDSIGSAVDEIVSLAEELPNWSYVDWTILVDGKLTGAQNLGAWNDYAFENAEARSITLEGKNGLDEETGRPLDSLDAQASEEEPNTTLYVACKIPVAIKNLQITGGHEDSGGGIVVWGGSTVLTLGQGALVEDNYAKYSGGGIYNVQATVHISSGATVTGNIADGQTTQTGGGGIWSHSQGGSYYIEGGKVIGNVTQNSGMGADAYIENSSFYLGGDTEISSIFLAKNGAIYIKSPLTAISTEEKVKVELFASYLTEGRAVLYKAYGSDDVVLADEIDKFYIPRQTTDSYNKPLATPIDWIIDETGKLAYKSAPASGSASVDNRALTIALDKTEVCLNDTITFSATASDGSKVTDGVTYEAELLWKGKEINAYGEDTYYVVNDNKLSFSKALPKTGTYQLYVTATQSINDTTAHHISSSQTFEISVTNEYTTPDTQVVLYNNIGSSAYYYLKDFDSVNTDLPASADMSGNSNNSSTAFDAFGNFYIFSSSKLTSNNPVIGSAGIDLSDVVGSGGTRGFVIDVKKNEAYAYCFNYDYNTGYTRKLFKFSNLLSSGDAEEYEEYTLEFNSSPNKIAIENEILYTYGSTGDYVASVYSLSEGTISGPNASVDVSENVDINYFSVSDMIVQDGKLYLTLKSSDTSSSDAGVWELYSRGAVVEIDFDKATPEVSTCGWISDDYALDTSSLSESYVYTYYVEKKVSNDIASYTLSSYQYHDNSSPSNPILLKCSDLQIPADDEDPDSSPKTLKFYAPTDSVSLNSSLYLSGPQKFVAIKPKKLVIADDGIMFYTDDLGAYKYRNVNRIVTIDLENFAGGIETEVDVKAKFDEDKSDNFISGMCSFTPIASASLYINESEFEYTEFEGSLFYNASSYIESVASAFDGQIFFNIPCGDN